MPAREPPHTRIGALENLSDRYEIAGNDECPPHRESNSGIRAWLGCNSAAIVTTATVCGPTPMRTINPMISNAHALSLRS